MEQIFRSHIIDFSYDVLKVIAWLKQYLFNKNILINRVLPFVKIDVAK